MTDFLRCPSCNMTFKSSMLLEKHREKFCIGGDVGRVRKTQTPQDMVNRLRHFRRKQEDHQQKHNMKELSDNKIAMMDHMVDPSKDKLERENTGKTYRVESRARDQDTQLRYLAEAHNKQINEIMSQNKILEKQRDDIVERLNEIAAQNRNASYLEKMIKHLNDQEQKNELLLETMKQQIDMLQAESMKRRMRSRDSDHPTPQRIEKLQPTVHHAYIPFYGGGSLTSEISAMRLTYLQNGGNDPVILAHLQDLLTEAQLIEKQEKHARPLRKKTKKEHGTAKWHMNEKLINLEMENQLLEEQLFKLQLQRQKKSRLPRTTSREPDKGLQLPKFLKEHTHQNITTLNAELEVLKHELEIQKLRRRIKTSVTRRTNPKPPAFLPMEESHDIINLPKPLPNLSHGLDPAPYDPIAGLVVFYDYLLGLDPSYRVCRLAVSLCNGGQEMGSPLPLPPVYCESSPSKFSDSKKQNLAILATKQAVPRVRPSPNISLIIELQASGGYDPYGQEVSRLIPRGWVKLDIFDYQNRVISGQWKVPIRILPVKPSLTTGALNGVPQLENAELYVRLVNARDADTQSLYPIDSNNSGFYKYPPLTSAYFYPEELMLPSPQYHPYLFTNTQATYGNNMDSPPSRIRIRTQ
ncbi:coiled-coil domain-containing protein 17-like [Spea bombifrons]|uniref:coiled-coil domain-containing protein 17-like n=1 Tax=Spea bombifrons TaxID=233779 RepID=UPI00234A3B56|nr:coiled-coil domain-containing protein 17-like [Spea bombifrons]